MNLDYRIRYFCPVNSLPDMDAKRRVQQEKIDRGDAAWTPYFTVDEPSEYGDVEYLAVMTMNRVVKCAELCLIG